MLGRMSRNEIRPYFIHVMNIYNYTTVGVLSITCMMLFALIFKHIMLLLAFILSEKYVDIQLIAFSNAVS